MKTHNIKILKEYADAIASGEKTFEIRLNDRNYDEGDIIKFEVRDTKGVIYGAHPITRNKYQITYVLSGWGLEKGYVVFSIKEVDDGYAE